jgi:hypothetical protein
MIGLNKAQNKTIFKTKLVYRLNYAYATGYTHFPDSIVHCTAAAWERVDIEEVAPGAAPVAVAAEVAAAVAAGLTVPLRRSVSGYRRSSNGGDPNCDDCMSPPTCVCVAK